MSVRLTFRVVRLSNRVPRRSASACTWLDTIVTDMLRRRAAAEKPPHSTTRPNTVRLVSRSIIPSDRKIFALFL